MSNKQNLLEETLFRLRGLYTEYHLAPGVFLSAGLKQGWNVVIGTNGQCGMAMSFTGWDDSFGKPRLDLKNSSHLPVEAFSMLQRNTSSPIAGRRGQSASLR
jgi:hypothetical protein